MLNFLKSEAGAILIWLFAALFGAAFLTPIIYECGKTVAPDWIANGGLLESVGGSIERAGPGRFFSRALLFCGIIFLYPLILRIKKIPARASVTQHRLQKLTWPQQLKQLAIGFAVGAFSLGLLVCGLIFSGATLSKATELDLERLLSKAIIPSLGAGVIEELIFRGLILGLWLRACSVRTALIGSSLIFSFVHFLKLPPGITIENPEAWYSGLQILGNIIGYFAHPMFFLTTFLTLLFLGLLLGYTRIKTASLWFPMGFHIGLVFVLKGFSLHYSIDKESAFFPWWIGADLTKGILPLIALAVAFGISAGVLKKLTPAKL